MDLNLLQRFYSDLYCSLFDEGILNQQFKALQQLQDKNDSTFVFQTISLFFEDTEKLINEIGSYINRPVVDYIKIKMLLHRLKGSCKFVGAQSVDNACVALKNFCEEYDFQGCLGCMQQLNQEFLRFKSNLETLFKLEQQIVATGGSIPKMQ